jgi:sialate O-acetylesterase
MVAAWAILCCTQLAEAEVNLPKVFTSHMVLQQSQPIVIWGTAKPGEKIAVTFNGETATAEADEHGKWRVRLGPMKADGKAHTLVVQGDNRITLNDVVLGEVWLASGQSNMNRPVSSEDIKEANYPNIRLFTSNGTIPRRNSLNDTVGWVACTPETIATCGDIVGTNNRRRPFSEVAYHFGRKLHEQLNVPVGVIHTSMGGSTARDWTPNPKIAEQYPFDKDHGDVRHKHGIVYQARLHAIIPFPIKGIVWYQGEDDGRNRNYAQDLEDLIGSWRERWNEPALPFYMVQIAQTTYAGGMLGVWEAQQDVMRRVPNTGLAVSNDIYDKTTNGGFKTRVDDKTGMPIAGGGNPHPTGRPLVARRLADIALTKTYGVGEDVVFGPMYKSHRVEGNKVFVKFQYSGSGLITTDQQSPNWFEISDGDRYFKADATIIDKDNVVVTSQEVSRPVHVRLGWHTLARFNLINKEGLPAVPFRTQRPKQ